MPQYLQHFNAKNQRKTTGQQRCSKLQLKPFRCTLQGFKGNPPISPAFPLSFFRLAERRLQNDSPPPPRKRDHPLFSSVYPCLLSECSETCVKRRWSRSALTGGRALHTKKVRWGDLFTPHWGATVQAKSGS